MNRPDRTWRDPDALCRVGKAHDVVKVAVPQHEHAIEAIENLLIVGNGDDRRVLIYGQLAQEVHHDLRPLRVKCGSRLGDRLTVYAIRCSDIKGSRHK